MARDPLFIERAALARAEKNLETARDELKTAAKRAGIDTAGLFSDSAFVRRANAEQWVEAAFENGRASASVQMTRDLAKALITDALGLPGPYDHLKALGKPDPKPERTERQMADTLAAGEIMKIPALQKFDIKRRARIALAWVRAEKDELPGKDKPMTNQDDSKTLALQIVNAGRRAKGLPLLAA
jgi:hypothetical protein